MDSRELAELQRLMKKASEAGLMDGGKMQSTLTQGGGKTQSISSAGAVTGSYMHVLLRCQTKNFIGF